MDRRLFLSAMFAPLVRAAPLPPTPPGGVVVLDNCDPVSKGKAEYGDGLTFLSARGKVLHRVGGLNLDDGNASCRRVAVDARRKNVWVTESEGGRLLRYGLDGKLRSSDPSVVERPDGIALDPATGNAWVTRLGREIDAGVDVYHPDGRRIARHRILGGYDAAFDARRKCVWLVFTDLIKVSLEGKELLRRRVGVRYGLGVAVDPNGGTVWVASIESKLFGYDSDGALVRSAELSGVPCRVAIDPRDSSVWVALRGRGVLHFSSDLKMKEEHDIPALSLDVDPRTGALWVATPDDVRKIDRKGKELSRTPHKAKTTQAWIAAW
jgi:hypothetical protein